MRKLHKTVGGSIVYYKPANLGNSKDWSIRFTMSKYLLCEGPGVSSGVGDAIFEEIAKNRGMDPAGMLMIDGEYVLPQASEHLNEFNV